MSTNWITKTISVNGMVHVGGIIPEIGIPVTACGESIPAAMVTATGIVRSDGPPNRAAIGVTCEGCAA